MKPLHIGLLVAAGALGGAFLMKVAQSPQPAPAPVAAQQQPATAPPPAETVTEPEKVASETSPSPFPEKEAVKSQAKHHREREKAPNVTVAQNTPPPAQAAPAPPPQPVQQTPPPPVAAPAPAPEPQQAAPPPQPAPEPPHSVTIAAGTMIPVRLVEALSSERNHQGDTFSATLDHPLIVDGFAIAERGARLEGKVVNLTQSGRVKGLGEIGIELTKIRTSDGQTVAVKTDTFTKVAPKTVKQDVERGAAATGIGAVIGAIAGGGKGAGIGAAVGAAAGVGGAVATRGKPAELPTETRITFRTSEPVTITEQRH